MNLTYKGSRRSFLKASGVLMAAAALNTNWARASDASGATAKQPPGPGDGWHMSHCRMCMRGDCPNMYRLQNGIVVEVKGNPAAPNSHGALCVRGHAIIQNLYNPYRVKAPMKRTNPKKGLNEDPGWVEISWDEALDTTAKKLKEIRDKDRRRFAFLVGFGDMNYFCTYLFYFAAAYGTPNYLKSNGTLCALHYAADLVQGVFPVTVADLTHAKYVINVGRHSGASLGACNGDSRGFINAVTSGKTKFVVVDPRCSPEAAKSEWVPIQPGTELPFLMAIAHTILYEIKKFDVETMRWATNAPYLIGRDGNYHRGADGKPQIYDLADKKVKSFDDKTLKTPSLDVKNMKIGGDTVTTGFVLVKESLKDCTPEWAAKLSTVPAASIRRISKEFIDNASLGKTIELKDKDGKLKTFPLRTSCVIGQRGLMAQRDGSHGDLMTKIINNLVGSLDVPGGNLACARGPNFLSPDADGVVEPKMEALFEEPQWPPQNIDLKELFPHRHSMPIQAFRSVLEPRKYGIEYEIDALLTIGGNAVSSTSEPYMVAEAVAKIPFSAVLAYNYDEMAHLADILLPSHALLEKQSVNCFESAFGVFTDDTLGLKMLMYRDPVKPIYNSRQSQDITMQLAERMGILPEFNTAINKMGVMIGEISLAFLDKEDYLLPDKRYTVREIWDKGVQKYFGKEYTMDRLDKDGLIVTRQAPAECYNTGYYAKGVTRFPFYFERLKRSGDGLRKFFAAHKDKIYLGDDWDAEQHLAYFEPVIHWRPNTVNKVKEGDKYDLTTLTYKTAWSPFRIGGVDQLPILNKTAMDLDPTYGTITLNTATAEKKGLKSGDMVVVETADGQISGKLYCTELLHPRVIGVAGSLGRLVNTLGPLAATFPHYNRITTAKTTELDPISGGVANARPARIYKQG